MRSFVAAVALSVVIIIVGIVSSAKIENVANELYDKTESLYLSLKEENTQSSLSALEAAEESFEKRKVLLEATSNHEEVLRIEICYKNVREFIEKDQTGDALASCSEIKLLLKHLPSNFKMKAENIL